MAHMIYAHEAKNTVRFERNDVAAFWLENACHYVRVEKIKEDSFIGELHSDPRAMVEYNHDFNSGQYMEFFFSQIQKGQIHVCGKATDSRGCPRNPEASY